MDEIKKRFKTAEKIVKEINYIEITEEFFYFIREKEEEEGRDFEYKNYSFYTTFHNHFYNYKNTFHIITPDGNEMICESGDYLIFDEDDIYFVKEDRFDKLFETNL